MNLDEEAITERPNPDEAYESTRDSTGIMLVDSLQDVFNEFKKHSYYKAANYQKLKNHMKDIINTLQ